MSVFVPLLMFLPKALGGSIEHFTTNDGFTTQFLCKIQGASGNAVREFRNPCRSHENVAQDT